MAYRVVVYDANIVRLIQVGEGKRWNQRKAKDVERRARTLAPKRSGRLAASHRTLQERSAMGRYQTGFRVEATAPYSYFVHRGTGIYGPRGRVIRVGKPMGPISGAGPRFIRQSRGQRAQPWLERAGMSIL